MWDYTTRNRINFQLSMKREFIFSLCKGLGDFQNLRGLVYNHSHVLIHYHSQKQPHPLALVSLLERSGVCKIARTVHPRAGLRMRQCPSKQTQLPVTFEAGAPFPIPKLPILPLLFPSYSNSLSQPKTTTSAQEFRVKLSHKYGLLILKNREHSKFVGN